MEYLKGLVLPSNVALALMALGVACLFFRRARRAAVPILIGSGVCLATFSSGVTATFLLSPLEYSYPMLRDPGKYPEVNRIVVLTAYATEDPEMPLSSQANSSALYRVVETLEIARRCDKCSVIVSGTDQTSRVMGKLLVSLGLPPERLVLDGASETTAASAATLRGMLGEQPFFLVTSAGHMPRTMATFRRQNLHAIAAPTDHLLPRHPKFADWHPGPFHLYASDLAVHEYVGILWYRITGRI